MKWFVDLKIARKLNALVAAMLAMMLALGAFSVFQLYELNRVTNEIDRHWAPAMRRALEIRYALAHGGALEVRQSLDAYAAMQPGGEEQQILARLQPMAADGADVRTAAPQAMALVERLVAISESGSAQAAQSADSTYLHARHMIFGFMAGALVLGLLLAARVARMISLPLARAVAVARRVADGDLRADADGGSGDETGDLLRAMNQMSANLRRMVTQVRGGTDTIASASAQISAGTGDLAQRTEGQAATLEETAATVEELATTVANNADKAQQAYKLMDQTAAVAREAEVAVSAVTATMERISASSRRIGDIVGLMDGIAFQTNLLALNAAVEAARAGEHGRGFAVVASEVRALAQRSTESAREIKALIAQSLMEVDGGGQAVRDAGATIDDVVSGVQRGAALMGEISHVTREQSIGLQLVNGTLASMDGVTQQNATLVEESLGAVMALQDQAAQLARSVSVFQLADAAAVMAAARSTRPEPVARRAAGRALMVLGGAA
ncbi:methyl-accepting chemotaxis protein [Duganella sp. P38]|uniref:methyl-accepting chemotaxis protein n=1 Tax=Duganella sp. P38 TaxID=3423949 RepID=UPI003D79A6D1